MKKARLSLFGRLIAMAMAMTLALMVGMAIPAGACGEAAEPLREEDFLERLCQSMEDRGIETCCYSMEPQEAVDREYRLMSRYRGEFRILTMLYGEAVLNMQLICDIRSLNPLEVYDRLETFLDAYAAANPELEDTEFADLMEMSAITVQEDGSVSAETCFAHMNFILSASETKLSLLIIPH